MKKESRNDLGTAAQKSSPPGARDGLFKAIALVLLLGLFAFVGAAQLKDLRALGFNLDWWSDANEQVAQDPLTGVFTNLQVHRIDLKFDSPDLVELGRSPQHYVATEFVFNGKKFADAKIRMKGNRSFQNFEGKPAFKVKFAKKKSFFGLRTLALNNMVEDPTLVRESLAYELYRSLGVPAPRTAYANIYVNDKPYGLHLIVEPFDELLLRREEKNDQGLLFEGEYSCDLYADDVSGLQEKWANDPNRILLQKLVEKVDAKGPLLDRLADDVDVDEVLTFLAVNQLLGDFDGYAHGHNYYLYFDPGRKKWLLLPWGQDRVFYKRPSLYESGGRLARECFGDAGCRLRYVKALQKVEAAFVRLDLAIAAGQRARLIQTSVKADSRIPFDREVRKEKMDELLRFIEERPAEIRSMTSCFDGTKEVDRDGDGFGCMDCDDESAAVNPSAKEVCNERDDNCSGLIDDHPACECQALEHSGRRFSMCDLQMSFAEAQKFCEARGETLAQLSSRKQAQALQKATQDIRSGDWWIGLTDREEEGEYVWIESRRESYQRWASSEPDVYACGQNCASINQNQWGNFRDLHCMERVAFICSSAVPTDPTADDELETDAAPPAQVDKPPEEAPDH